MAGDFIPRPATLTLRLEGVRVVHLHMEVDVARMIARSVRAAKQAGLSDSDVSELIAAAISAEVDAYRYAEGGEEG